MKKYANRMAVMEYSAGVISGLFGSMQNPNLISFGVGSPAAEALPIDIVREICNDVVRKETRGVEALQYGPIMGTRNLRQIIIDQLLAPKGMNFELDNVMVVSGGLEGVYLTCQVLLNPGDVILVESPTFMHAMEIFDMFEVKCIGVEMDENGMKMDDLEAKIKEYNPKLVYVIPTFQNPTGRTLPVERRQKIAELGTEYDIVILEDDPYRDIRYSGVDLPTIKSFDKSENTILANSFSKIFSPGSRLGYIVADERTIKLMGEAKTATNSHTAMLTQIICEEFFARGYYPEHHKMLCNLYRERRDAMMACLDKYFPEGSKYNCPDGGLFTWVELPEEIDTSALLKESLEDPEVAVAFVAGEGFFAERGGKGKNCMRLSFGCNTPEVTEIGMQRLGKFICSKVSK